MKKHIALFIFAAVVLSGCFPSVGNSSKAPAAGEFAQGEIVKSFPSTVPLFENAQVVQSYGGPDGYGASLIVDESLAKVVNFYQESLGKLGWESKLSKKSETNYVFEIKNGQYSGDVIVNTAADGKKTAITFALRTN